VEDHERHHVPAWRARHGLVGRDDPFDCSRETLESIQFDIATVKFWESWKCEQRRHCGCERTRSSRGKREREEADGKQSPKPALDARF
jgi:hypothetical protein